MRARTLALFAIALLLAAGTALFARSWLAQRAAQTRMAAPVVHAPPPREVLVARQAIARGQILKPSDFSWQVWPSGSIDPAYILSGTRSPQSFAGWVAREPFGPGEPITTAKIVAPGDRSFLAAVLHPGMRAVSIPVTATSSISGFVSPGDRVDVVMTQTVPASSGGGEAGHREAETILHDVRVLAIDQRLSGTQGEATLAHTATLEVTPKQSEIIAVATEMGRLSLSLRGLDNPRRQARPDSSVLAQDPSYTLDSQINPVLPTTVTILRGDGKTENATVPQSPSRGT
ncbi:MAG TPA: Flp pilus assembly protein CpaB [Stellaceae bacterium]|nr:Flp pilus assembly protein CpaB [Stellaceae bacterium]